MNIRIEHDALHVDCSVASRDVLWLGSGFSTCVTSGQLPLVGNFFDQLEEFESPLLHRFLRQCFDNPRKANVEEALNALEQLQCAPFSGDACSLKLDPETAAKAKDELGKYCIRRLAHSSLRPNHWAYRFMVTTDEATTVVTTNYDCCAEQILATRSGLRHASQGEPTCHNCRLNAVLGYDCACGPRSTENKPPALGSLLKLHGSISWRTCCSDGSCNQKDCIVPVVDHWNTKCGCCSCPTNPVLILPSMTKTYSAFPHLQRMWDGTREAIEGASRIFVFGFSFPSADAALSQYFRRAVRKAQGLTDLVVIDANPEPVIERIRLLLGSASKVRLASFTVPVDGTQPVWLIQGFGQYRVDTRVSETIFNIPDMAGKMQPTAFRTSRSVVKWCPTSEKPSPTTTA